MNDNPRIVVVGLGYVGLPLAIALAQQFETIGIDIDVGRIAELERGHDRTNEIDADRLVASSLRLTSDPATLSPADVYIVTVPTPVDGDNQPDLTIVRRASEMVGRLLDGARRPIVCYESTVYPGVTEELCGPILEQVSGLKRGQDFFLGYSPERINPGDREHTIDRITKVVAGENDAIAARLEAIYGAVTSGGTFRAASIKVAEAAKVIENAQRDINIAFMNEITQIFSRMNISVWDVLQAARTKWNFLPFEPGLVGGHCIGVDPYYLSHRARELGCEPRVILAGRNTNDGMAEWVADSIHQWLGDKTGRILVLGLSFKRNVPDLRNSKVVDLIAGLRAAGFVVDVHDPMVSQIEATEEYGIPIISDLDEEAYDMIVLAVPHEVFVNGFSRYIKCLRPDGKVADLTNALVGASFINDSDRWTL